MASDQFEFDLVSDFDSYVSSQDKTKAGPRILVRGSKNVIRKTSDTVGARPGLKRRGSADATLAAVKSSYEWNTSLSATRVLRVCNSKFQVESDIVTPGTYVWYDLMTSLTQTRFVFDPWWDNTNKQSVLLFVKGDSNIHKWDGGLSLIASGTINTITKSDATTTFAQDGFLPTGTITINGVDYTYTGGANTATLTGTSDASLVTAGLVGYSKIVTTANTPSATYTNDFIKVNDNQLYIGSYNSLAVYVSQNLDYTNYTVPTPRVTGDPEYILLDSPGKGLSVRTGNVHIFGGTSDLYIISFSQININNVQVEITKRDKKQIGNLSSALGHEFIDILGNNIYYIDQNNQLRAYGSFRNLFQDASIVISQVVLDELADQDFTGGHLRIISGNQGDMFYITEPINGSVYLYQELQTIDTVGNAVAKRIWQPPQIWNVSRIAVIDGVVYGHSNSNPQIYQLWDTLQWHDDSPSGDPLPYTCVMRMSYKRIVGRGGPRRQGLLTFDKTFYEGYMTPGTNLYANVYFGYQGAQALEQLIINDIDHPAVSLSGLAPTSIGGASLGDNPLGDGLNALSNDQELLPKFVAIRDVNPVNCFEYELEVYSTDPDSRWEILSLGVNATMAEQQATWVRK